MRVGLYGTHPIDLHGGHVDAQTRGETDRAFNLVIIN